jgi:hypothetical protein
MSPKIMVLFIAWGIKIALSSVMVHFRIPRFILHVLS